MKKKLGLALGGGGACGIAHVGFLRALMENDVNIHSIVGTSMGAIVGAIYCAGVSFADMVETINDITLWKIMDIDPLFLKSCGFVKGKKAEDIISHFLKDKTFKDLKPIYGCVATDMKEHKAKLLTDGDLVKSVLASMSIPGVFRPVMIDGHPYLDGAVVDRVPCSHVRALGADVVIGVDVLGEVKPPEKYRNMIDLFTDVYSFMEYQVSLWKRDENKADMYIVVEQEDISPLSIKNVDRSLKYGYECAMKNMSKIKDMLW